MMRTDLRSRPPASDRAETSSQRMRHAVRNSIKHAIFIFIFILGATIIFTKNADSLFHSEDARYVLTEVEQAFRWDEFDLTLTGDIFQGLMNVQFSMSPHLIPGYLLPHIFAEDRIDQVFSYTVFGAEIFISLYVLALAVGLRSSVGALGGATAVLLTMPVYEGPLVAGIMRTIPQSATCIATSLLVLAAFCRVGRDGWKLSFFYVIVIGFLVARQTSGQVAHLVLMAPTLAVVGGAFIAASRDRRELGFKCGAAVALLGFYGASGAALFVYGVYEYTAAYFMGDILTKSHTSLKFAGILFHFAPSLAGKGIYGPAGPLLYLAGVGGALWAAIRSSGMLRSLGCATCLLAALIVAAGVAHTQLGINIRPSPDRFEIYAWPFYALFAAYLVVTAASRGVFLVAHSLHRCSALPFCQLAGAYTVLAAVMAIPIVVHEADPTSRRVHFPFGTSPIIERLISEIGLAPGSTFRGTAVSYIDAREVGNGTRYKATGNAHEYAGLWAFDIPTLDVYNALQAPTLSMMAKHFLSGGGLNKNRVVVNRPNERVLASMGVRFALSSRPLEAYGPPTQTLSLRDDASLYLHELDNPNTGDYAPTRPIVRRTAAGTITAMKQPGFDFAEDVVIRETIESDLVPVSRANVTVIDRGTIRVMAESAGTSLLLLPLQFSRCLELVPTGPTADVRIIRANLWQTGLLFTNAVSATIDYRTGPFTRPRCRHEDANDMREMEFAAALR